MNLDQELQKFIGKKIVVFTPGFEKDKTRGFVHDISEGILTLKLEVVGTLICIPISKISKFMEAVSTEVTPQMLYTIAQNDFKRVHDLIASRKDEKMVLSTAKSGFDKCLELEQNPTFQSKAEIKEWKTYFKDICAKCGLKVA